MPENNDRAGSTIHPTAIVHDGATLGRNVHIGAFAVVGEGAVIGDRCTLLPHAIVRGSAELGERVCVHSFAVAGGDPQDLSFDPAIRSGVRIGDRTTLREGATVNRATSDGVFTIVESDVYMMANSHVGHDCHIGRHVVVAGNVMLAGHVEVGTNAFLGGGSGIHQFSRIGEGAMVGGNASIAYDVPPFTIAAERNGLIGLNLVGLRRRDTPSDAMDDLKRCFFAVFGSGDVRRNAAHALAAGDMGKTEHGKRFLTFCEGGKRGFVRPRRKADRREQG